LNVMSTMEFVNISKNSQKYVLNLEIHDQPDIQSLELQFKGDNDSTIEFHILHSVHCSSIIAIQTNECELQNFAIYILWRKTLNHIGFRGAKLLECPGYQHVSGRSECSKPWAVYKTQEIY